jgi:hypothetical protein
MAHGSSLFSGHFPGWDARNLPWSPGDLPPEPVRLPNPDEGFDPSLRPPPRKLEEDGGDDHQTGRTSGGIGAFDPSVAGIPSYNEFLAELSHIPDEAYPSPTALADMYAASIPQSKSVLSGISGRPLGETFENWVSGTGPIGGMLSMASGIPGWGYALDAIGDYTKGKQAGHYAMSQQGVPGYSAGMIGGNPFTISPGLFGLGVTGNVNVDVGTIQNMQAVAAGIDPNTGLSLVSGTGQGGYNEAGDWVDEYGNVMGGTMESAQDLADKHGISLGDALAALADAHSMPGTTTDDLGNVMGGGLGMSIQSRQSRSPEAARYDWDEGGGWVEELELVQPETPIDTQSDEESAAADDEYGDTDYGGEFGGEEDEWHAGGPVIKRRGSGETATSPLAAGSFASSFVDKPLYDRAVDTSPTYRRW